MTKWVNSFVIVEKKVPADSNTENDHSSQKKLRICLDPCDLNEALETDPYYTRSIEKILGEFHDMTMFTIADFNKGFWMVELHPDSRTLTTMALDIGKFQWTQLPLGSIMAHDVFQRKFNTTFLSVPGVTGLANDMIIFGKPDQEHDRNLLNFLGVCRKNNLTLDLEMIQFRLPKVSFFGHIWSGKGLSPDPKKIESVKRMEISQDVETMRSFLGLINNHNRFSTHLAELNDPLTEICRQKMELKLNKACKVSFQHCKEEISKNITLPYFNPKPPTILETDGSKKGLGVVILLNSTPVVFASRALAGSEKNYQKLERKCLVTIWGMEKFHYFLYGKEFTLETDQKPLVSIYKKHIVEISPRIQNLVVRNFSYQPFDLRYRKGVEISLADTLRHYK